MKLEKLNQMISESNISKQKISEMLNIRYDTLRRKLRGEREFKISELEQICKIININIKEVI